MRSPRPGPPIEAIDVRHRAATIGFDDNENNTCHPPADEPDDEVIGVHEHTGCEARP